MNCDCKIELDRAGEKNYQEIATHKNGLFIRGQMEEYCCHIVIVIDMDVSLHTEKKVKDKAGRTLKVTHQL